MITQQTLRYQKKKIIGGNLLLGAHTVDVSTGLVNGAIYELTIDGTDLAGKGEVAVSW